MALLEKIQKTIIRLGLVPKIIKNLPKISLLLTIIGVIWIAILPMEGQYRGTYISENALMPSQAYSYFRESEWNLLRGYRTQLQGFQTENMTDYSSNLQIMKSWLNDIGYKTEIHHSEQGDNLYGVWHAPRADDTEAIVLGAAYYNSDGMFNVGGLSLTIALARYFHRWGIWSKNIIIVIPQDPNFALRSWVNAYHSTLDLTGGSIEAAIMLDYPYASDNFEHVELYYEGLNGQLPNLDLVNVAVSISEHEGPRVSIQGTSQDKLQTNDYWSRLRILTRGIVEMALAGLRPGHGNEAYSGWRVQAITLKAKGETGPYDITTFGRIPEAIFRSVNNLLEKFHQSFFFYFLLAPRNFVSIGTYLPAAILVIASFVVSSLDKALNSGFEVSHLVQFGIPAGAIIFSSTFIGLVISQLVPFLPIIVDYSLIGVFGILSFTPFFYKLTIKDELKTVLRSISLLYYSTVLSSLLVLNFSLTFAIGLLALPLTFINDRLSIGAKVACLLVSNPFILLILISQDFKNGLGELFYGLITSSKQLDCHTWLIITLGWLPTWLSMGFSTLIYDETRSPVSEKKTE